MLASYIESHNMNLPLLFSGSMSTVLCVGSFGGRERIGGWGANNLKGGRFTSK